MLTVVGQVIFANHLSDGILEPKGFVVILESEAI
jgi:cyclomaltodextrinase